MTGYSIFSGTVDLEGMKCYVGNGRLKFIVLADSHEHAAMKALVFWGSKYPKTTAASRTKVSEVGFEFLAKYHSDDTVFVTADLVRKS